MNLSERIDSSILGKKSRVVKSSEKPRSVKLIIGDLSSVEIP